jgi:hypothetical protein
VQSSNGDRICCIRSRKGLVGLEVSTCDEERAEERVPELRFHVPPLLQGPLRRNAVDRGRGTLSQAVKRVKRKVEVDSQT